MKQKQTIEMQRAWLQRLLELTAQYESATGFEKDTAEKLLLGYISSAKFLIEHL
jgi:hypothetical protein